MRKLRGVTLIIVAGVLAVLSALGAGFYAVMMMETKSANRYVDLVRAGMLAQAGIQNSIGQLRAQLFKNAKDESCA